jgi:hypothetical protein
LELRSTESIATKEVLLLVELLSNCSDGPPTVFLINHPESVWTSV